MYPSTSFQVCSMRACAKSVKATEQRLRTFQAVESHGVVREPLPAPGQIPPFPSGIPRASVLPSDIRSLYRSAGAEASLAALEQLTACSDLASNAAHPRSAFPFEGGEAEGLKRLRYCLYGESADALDAVRQGQNPRLSADRANGGRDRTDAAADAASISSVLEQVPEKERASGEPDDLAMSAAAPIDTFKDTRMMASGVDNSAKLSAYLAAGCLSPGMVYAEIQKAKQQKGGDSGHSWLIMHLTIR